MANGFARTHPWPVRVLCSPRTLFTESIPPILYPPCIFVGLLLGLWTWKCFWIVIMQNKLLYLSWLPPFSRSDTVAEYETQCKPVRWEEKQICSLDGTKLAICEGHIPCDKHESSAQARQPLNKVVVCYFQGNGGSTPLRLPLLSQVLKGLSAEAPAETEFKVVALSYRGYWKSSGRATQSGIQRDAQAFLNWASDTYSSEEDSTRLQLILWGHSLGSAVATSAIPAHLSRRENAQLRGSRVPAQISGVVMEAPTSSIKDMLISLYPQRWLPYRYLWPFSWNTWCNASNLTQIVDWREEYPLAMSRIPPILILSAENDEVIPPYVAGQLEQKGLDLGLDIFRKEVRGAMHTEAPMKEDGRKALIQFICDRTSTTG
ncbi:Alpha/beta hydrolase fold-1 domain-containing protein [Penicillium ucsense]|uniref:Alpha/beta hydrolase fold-1 domain-containing protein n=1 Tax=Penicillium ucsense TaxID=2839758 RepID=A0A8J8W1S2_9EURO|nr:Alpha/beta hydrolase fold-1 domain-containing protein [Penicillium ucsense]KAF7733619.1 Alpha/beta hydrolase fold-1 domain-containing protein [Penicillium ucsense]